jgi:hypothetical protein
MVSIRSCGKLLTLITEMQRCAAEMRKLSSDHQIRDFGSIHVLVGGALILVSSMIRLQRSSKVSPTSSRKP